VIGTGYLSRRQPVIKLAAVIALSLVLFFAIDPITPLLFLAVTLVAGWRLGGIAPAAYLRALAPLAVVGLGFVWTNAVFARTVDPDAPAWSIGPLRATLPGLLFGLAIALRGLAIGALSVTFVLTTDPADLAVGLIRHARVPFRIAYPTLAAYRFLPLFRDEIEQIELARRVRGQLLGGDPFTRAARRVGEIVPLLASAVGRASRIAVAMDARGFAASRRRTYLRASPLTGEDIALGLAAVAVGLALFGLSAAAGWLRLWDGRFAI
jgi:energy-coupling factor transport system permease protein